MFIKSDAECISRVLKGGLSRKGKDKGGNGLRQIDALAESGDNSLLLSSGTASVKRESGEIKSLTRQPLIPGTRALVILKTNA